MSKIKIFPGERHKEIKAMHQAYTIYIGQVIKPWTKKSNQILDMYVYVTPHIKKKYFGYLTFSITIWTKISLQLY